MTAAASSAPAQPLRAAAQAFRVPSLDGIRALSFLMVFCAHAGLERVVPGGFGVTVFFFLSGYLITTLLRMEAGASGTVSLREFYLRRALRILPPFYLVLALAVLAAWTGVLPGGVSLRAVAAQAMHLANYWIVAHGYDGQPAGTGVYWSLAVEEHFYLVFPCFYLLLRALVRDGRRQAIVLWGLTALVLGWRLWLVYGLHAPSDRTYVASDTRIDSILFGCALAVFGNPMLDEEPPLAADAPERRVAAAAAEAARRDAVWKRALLPASLAVLLATFVVRDPGFRETVRYTLQGLALSVIFVVAVRYPRWAVLPALNLRVVQYIGVISYPLYLVHHVVLYALQRAPIGGVPRALIALAASVALAAAIHEAVEKPCARLRKRLSLLIASSKAPRMSAPSRAVAEGTP